MLTNDARHTREGKSRLAMAKAAFNKDTLFTSKLDLNLSKNLVKCYVWNIAVYGAGTRLFKKVNQNYFKIFES
jgi:hypothetical protein